MVCAAELFLISAVTERLIQIEELSNDAEDTHMSHPLLSQTICTALQIALVDLLVSWGVYPESVTGHSSGEMAAAYACGALSMEDAMAVSYYRGVAASQILMTEVRGSMMAIGMSPEEAQPYLNGLASGKVVVACVNSPSSVTVSGDAEAINELAAKLKDEAVFGRRLAVDVAYHSHHMELVAREYLAAIEHIRPLDRRRMLGEFPLVSFFSSVTGRELQPSELGPQYWVSNLLGQVKFAESLKTLCFETSTRRSASGLPSGRRTRRTGAAQKASVDCLLEVGPHSAMAGPVKQILGADVKLKAADIVYASVLSRRSNAVISALTAMSTLASLNYEIDFEAINLPNKAQDGRTPKLLVDLPPYNWNHSRSYWAEPRLSKVFRNRECPRSDLLGATDNMACPFEPRWRNFLRVSEIPWLADHKIQSGIVLPAAGYLSIAVEAVMQSAKNIEDLAGVVLQDISIRAALMIPETAGIEIMTSLQIYEQFEEDSSNDWYRFRIYSVSNDNNWTEHCAGVIGIERRHEQHEPLVCDLDDLAKAPPGSMSDGISIVDVNQLYENLRRVGLEYGPCFANLSSAHSTKNGICLGEITIPDTAAVMPMNFEHPLLVHPCTLDSTFHTIFAALPNESLQGGPLIPVSIESMRIPCRIKSVAGDVLSTYTNVRSTGAGDILASITLAVSGDSFGGSDPKLSITGLRCRRLEIAPNDATTPKDVPIAYGIDWQPDPDFLFARHDAWSRYIRQHDEKMEDIPSREVLDVHIATVIKDVLSSYEAKEGSQSESVRQYKSNLAELLHQQPNHHPVPKQNEATNFVSMDLSEPYQKLLHALGHHLSAIFSNDEATKKTTDTLWTAYWEMLSQTRAYRSAARYVDLIGNKKPDMSVLDINQGAAKPCTTLLRSLAGDVANGNRKSPRCTRYTFAYADDSDIELANEELNSWPELVDFMKLNTGTEITGQATNKASYDVIILHGLASLHTGTHALINVKYLLRPSGNIIILPGLDHEQGLLDVMMLHAVHQWPASQVNPTGHTVTETIDLKRIIDDAGLVIWRPDNPSPHESPLDDFLICRSKQAEHVVKKDILIIGGSAHHAKAAAILRDRLLAHSSNVTTTEFCQAQPGGKICVVFNDPQENVFTALNEEVLQKLKDIFLRSAGVLWITQGSAIYPTSPEAGLAIGFARTARSESSVKPIITLDLDAKYPLQEHQVADLLFFLVKHRFIRGDLPDDDVEYAERGGTLFIPRIRDRPDLNRDIARVDQPNVETEQSFNSENQPLRLARANPTKLGPHFTADTRMTQLPAGFVGIEVMAFGLGEYDLQYDTAESEASDTLGLECSGRVYAVGSGVDGLKTGDRVVCLGSGTARTLYHDHESAFEKMEDPMSYELAAALPVAYSTAYYIVHNLARVEGRDTVLIHNAESWLGQAIVEVCSLTDATSLVTVTTSLQKNHLLERFKILKDRIHVTGKGGSSVSFREFLGDKKADIVIDVGDNGHQNRRLLWHCVAPFGRLIQVSAHESGLKRIRKVPNPSKNVSFSAFSVLEFQKEKTDLAREILTKVVKLFNDGRLRGPRQFPVYGVKEIEKAVTSLPSDQHSVLVASSNSVVKVCLLTRLNEYNLISCRQYSPTIYRVCSETMRHTS